MILPWQQQIWDALYDAKKQNRLPHAFLFAGPKGVGKTTFAYDFARSLLCDTRQLIAAKVHPNLFAITKEEQGAAIKIDQIRAVTEFIQHTSLQGEYRIVIIEKAHTMNTYAANALLKTLEEPSSGALLILISDQFQRLPATILSRCQRIIFNKPAAQLALKWLKDKLASKIAADPDLLLRLADGAPLKALQLAQDEVLCFRKTLFETLFALAKQEANPLQAAVNFTENDIEQLFDFIISVIIDSMRLQLQVPMDELTNQDQLSFLSAWSQHATLKKNATLMVYLQQLRQQFISSSSLNKQLMIENIFVRWSETCS